MPVAISVEHLSKTYRLGQIGTGTFTNDLTLWWAKVRRKPNPLLRIGETDHGNRAGEMIWALKDVSFTVEQGEVLGIIGRNGAGKSTLLKILSRVTAPTYGRIRVKGHVASLLEVGTGFHPELTGRENIYLNGAILGMSREEIDRKFDEIVDFSGIEQFVDTPVKRYSSGMYVRLAFAVAAHLDPEVLVVDEVLAVGDAAFQKKCLGKMEEVAKAGRTVLFVSHNMNAITGLTSRSIYIRSGCVSTMGETGSVVNTYLNEIVHESSEREGFADLRGVKRGAGIVNPIAQFESVRTLNQAGIERARFVKAEPFVIEAGFYLTKSASQLQFGYGIRHAESGIQLFVSPSPTYHHELGAGHHKIRMLIEPNYLLPSLYSITLKMFCGGVRQDHLKDALFFSIIEDPAVSKEEVFTDQWSSGLINLIYQWQSDFSSASPS